MERGDRKYRDSHEWVKIVGDTAVVGISDFAQGELGDITYVELPGVGTVVSAGGECGTVESVKTAADILAPVGGTVIEINEVLEAHPEVINGSPYDDGWMFKLGGLDLSEAKDLMDAEAYQAMVDSAA